MNASGPTPSGPSLPFTTEGGAPLTVHITHAGEQYTLRLTTTIMGVWPAGGTDPNGIPVFNVQAAPVMMVTKEKKA